MSFRKKTKVDFVEAIYYKLLSSHPKISKNFVKTVVDTMLLEMKQSLIEGQQIELRGFGIFEFRYRKPKLNARNPRSGKKVTVDGHSIVAFRAGNHLRESVWSTNYGNEPALETNTTKDLGIGNEVDGDE